MALALYMVLKVAEYPIRLCVGHPRGNRNSSPKLASEVEGPNYECFLPVHLFMEMRNDSLGTRERTLLDTIFSPLKGLRLCDESLFCRSSHEYEHPAPSISMQYCCLLGISSSL
jgi:hypothetical protein